MRLKDFEQGLDRYGAAIEDWPAPLRSAASALLAADPAAAKLHAQAMRLDALFASPACPEPPATSMLVARITELPRQTVATRSRRFGALDFGWARAAALAGCVIAGFVVGTADYASTPQHEDLAALLDVHGVGAEPDDE